MNAVLQSIRNFPGSITHQRFGTWLALLIVAFLPNYGIEKYGPSPVIPAALLCLLGIWLVWRERMALFANAAQRRWSWLFLLLVVPVALSVPASFAPRMSLSILLVLCLYFFAGVALIRALADDVQRAWLVKWVAVILLVWMADTIIQYLLGRDLLGVTMTADGRAPGPFFGNLRLSLYLSLLLPILLWWLWPRGALLALAAFGAAIAVAMMGGARNALVYLVIVGAGLFWRLPGGRQKWLTVMTLAVFAGIAITLTPTLQERFSRFGLLMNPTFENVDRLLSYRLTIWDTAANMVQDRPLLGVGAGAFQKAYAQYSTLPNDIYLRGDTRAFHAHQLYVGMTAETGLVGLLALVAIIFLCIRWYWMASASQRTAAWPFALGLTVYAFPVNSQPVLYQQWLFPVLLLLLAGMLAALESGSGTARQ